MKNIREFLRLLRPYRKKACFAFISILIANLLGLAFPWVIKIIIDEVLVKKDFFLLNALTAGLVAVFILRFYFGYVREYLVSFIGENIVYDLRGKLYWHVQRLSVGFIENNRTGRLVSGLIGDVDSIKKFLFGGLIDFIYSFFNLFFVLCILIMLDWRLALISLVYLPVFGLTFFKLTPRLKARHSLVREKYAEMTARLNEVFTGIRVVAGFAKERHEADRFSLTQKEIMGTSLEGHRVGIFLWMGSEFITSMGLVTIIWFGARAVFTGRISAGMLMAFYSYLGMLFIPVIKIVVINNYYQEAAASLDRVRIMLSQEPKVKEKKRPIVLDTMRGDLIFKGVGFSYDGKREVLSDINLDVKRSDVVALVGKSGAGKSTLINLVLRFYDPVKGSIHIDGHDLKDCELKSYRSKIAMVLQDDYLFSASIRENILYGNPEAPDVDLIEAAKLANAHQFITELPDGYDTQIGERGIKLSYGQRQRISIARALLRNPTILILDEATSNVDSETERLIVEQAYKNLIRNRTTFIIAHRLSTVTHADKIVFIEDGRIVESGKHLELLDKKENYWKMWTQQTGSGHHEVKISEAIQM